MSHTVRVAVQFKVTELPQLTRALEVLGWKLVQNGQARQYGGTSTSYPYVAVNPDKTVAGYDVGIKAEGEALGFYTDFYGGSVGKTLGEGFFKLKQEFASAVIEDEAAALDSYKDHPTVRKAALAAVLQAANEEARRVKDLDAAPPGIRFVHEERPV